MRRISMFVVTVVAALGFACGGVEGDDGATLGGEDVSTAQSSQALKAGGGGGGSGQYCFAFGATCDGSTQPLSGCQITCPTLGWQANCLNAQCATGGGGWPARCWCSKVGGGPN